MNLAPSQEFCTAVSTSPTTTISSSAALPDADGGMKRLAGFMIKAGILDRDSLSARSDWDAFFDTDDASFSARHPFGEWIYVLRCWEIESYLLHPLVIETFLADAQGRSVRDEARVTEELFGILCDLIPIVAGSLVLTSYGMRRIDVGFGMGRPFLDVYGQVGQRLSSLSPDVAELLDACIEQICNFGAQHNDRSTAHWLDQIRGIDGKRLLRWLSHHYRFGRDVRFHLASLTRDRGLIDVLLDGFFDELIAP